MKAESKVVKGMVYRTDGSLERIELTEKNRLDALQKLVGGLIEIVYLISTKDEEQENYVNGKDLVINEEGRLLELPPNPWSHMITQGTRWQGQVFFGDVVKIHGRLD